MSDLEQQAEGITKALVAMADLRRAGVPSEALDPVRAWVMDEITALADAQATTRSVSSSSIR